MSANSSACSQPGWGWAPPPHQYLQWWCHSWKDWGIIWAVVSWGLVCQGPLSRGCGLGKYYPVFWRGLQQVWLGIWGPPLSLTIYCTNHQSPLVEWPCLMSSCKTFIRSARGVTKRFPPLPWGWGDPQPNSVPLPEEDDGTGGPTAPQGVPLPCSEKAYPWFHLLPIQHSWHFIFQAHDSCLKGGE